MALSQRNIPFRKYGGLRFLEAAHIKDLVSILRILENPRDEIALFRVLQLLGGVGPKTAESIYNHLSENSFDPCSIATFNAPSAAKSDISRLVKIIEELSPGEDIPPSVQLDRINELYSPLLDKYYDNPVPRRNDIEHLAELATRYTTRSQFLAELVLEPPVSTGDFAGPPILDEDWLVLSTIHSAKGLEWDAVYLIHAADGCLPSDLATGDDEEIEEELRLTYVAMTRAKDYLYVLWPMMFYTRPTLMSGNHVYAQLCRFFTPEVLETMEKVERQDVADIEDKSADFSGPDIKDRILGMWD